MPRLAGKRTNPAAYVMLIIGVLILALVLLEYFSVINLIPGFGV